MPRLTQRETGHSAGTPDPITLSTQRLAIAQRARQDKQCCFQSLNHVLNETALREAYQRTRKDGACGIDGVQAQQYAQHLDDNITALLERVRSGCYRAPPVRRVYIPKANGKSRPIGIPTFEDKLLQRAVVMLMETIYEQDFLNCSHGFRVGRSAHSALRQLRETLTAMGGGYVIELDIKSFFDSVDKSQLRTLIQQRINDGIINRLIGKWLKAGVLESGTITYPEHGTPQGGVISPLLANIYLHYVLDQWLADEIKPNLRGRMEMVRYADDAVIVCSNARDAYDIMQRMKQRFSHYALTLHPEKTRLVHLHPVEQTSFDFLGFTHYWRRTPRGQWKIQRHTAKDRFARSVKTLTAWCRRNRHLAIGEQHATLTRKLRGMYNYYGISGNIKRLRRLLYCAENAWQKWLRRRSQRDRGKLRLLSWLTKTFPLPKPCIMHPTI